MSVRSLQTSSNVFEPGVTESQSTVRDICQMYHCYSGSNVGPFMDNRTVGVYYINMTHSVNSNTTPVSHEISLFLTFLILTAEK